MREVWNRFNKVEVIQLAAALFWFLVRCPGIAHTDTAFQLALIEDGQVTNQWTLNWFLLLKYLTFDGQSLALITAIQILVALFTFRRLAQAIKIQFPRSQHAVTWLIASPIFGYLATTVNHDWLAACGVILMFVLLYEMKIGKLKLNRMTLVVSALLSSFSYISVFAFLFSMIFVIYFLRTTYVIGITILFVSILIVNFGLPSLSPNEMKGVSLVSDIKCATEDTSTQLNESQSRILSSMATIDYWKTNQGYSCASSNQIFSSLEMSKTSDSQLISLWVSLGIINPGSFVKAHLIKAGVAVPPPFASKPAEVFELGSLDINVRKNVEFLTMDRSASPNYLGPLSRLTDLMDLLAFSINLSAGWLSWAGLWLLVISLLIARQLLVHKTQIMFTGFLITLGPLLASHIFVFLAAPLSEARYLLPTILIGLCLLFAYLYELVDKYFVKRS